VQRPNVLALVPFKLLSPTYDTRERRLMIEGETLSNPLSKDIDSLSSIAKSFLFTSSRSLDCAAPLSVAVQFFRTDEFARGSRRRFLRLRQRYQHRWRHRHVRSGNHGCALFPILAKRLPLRLF
jgi:hypothetical protein